MCVMCAMQVVDGPNVTAPAYAGVAQLLGLAWGPLVVLDVSSGAEEREAYNDGTGEEDAGGGGGGGGGGGKGTSWRNPHEAAVAAAVVRQVAAAWRALRSNSNTVSMTGAGAATNGAGGVAAAATAEALAGLTAARRSLSIGVISPYRWAARAGLETI